MYKIANNPTFKVWMNEIGTKTISLKINKTTMGIAVDEQAVPNGTEIPEAQFTQIVTAKVGSTTEAGVWLLTGVKPQQP